MFSLNLEDFFMNFCKLRVWIFLMYGLDIFKKNKMYGLRRRIDVLR